MNRKGIISKPLKKQLEKLAAENKYAEACELLKPAAQRGNPAAQCQMGNLLLRDMRAKEDYADIGQAVDWYEKAAAQNFFPAMKALANLYIPFGGDFERDRKSASFTLPPNLERALDLYARLCAAGERYIFSPWGLCYLLDLDEVTPEMKDKVVKTLFTSAEEGSREAAAELLAVWEEKFRFPDRGCYDVQKSEHELLQSSWFKLLLDDETECEKTGGYSGTEATRLLSDLARKGNREALDLLTDIGGQGNSAAACWAGHVHYEKSDYASALKCFHNAAGKRGSYAMLGRMYEHGEGTAPDVEKAFHYYKEADDLLNMGRMYEQGIGTKKDRWKALDCYRTAIAQEIWEPEGREADMRTRICRKIRRLKKALFAKHDSIGMTVKTRSMNAVCSFTLASCDDCHFKVDWGDGTTQQIDNEQGGALRMEHIYIGVGTWHIAVEGDETHTITSLHYTCTTCILSWLNVSNCPVLTDLYCVDQNLCSLDVSQNPRLERLVCRNNRLKILNIEKNLRLTQLDCSDNKDLSSIYWKADSPLRKVCIDLFMLAPYNDYRLEHLLKLNNGELTGPMPEERLEHLQLWVAYYMRCCNWTEMMRTAAEKVESYCFEHQSLRKRKCAFNAIRRMAMDVPWDNEPFQLAEIRPSGRIECDETQNFSFFADYAPEVSQSFEDTNLFIYPWRDCLAMPVELKEYESWLMFPLIQPVEIAAPCFCLMTDWYVEETEEKAEKYRQFRDFRRKAEEDDKKENLQ